SLTALAALVAGVRARWAVRPRRLSRPGQPSGAAGLPGAGPRLFVLAGTGHRVGPEAGRQPGDRLRHVLVTGAPGPGDVVAGPGLLAEPTPHPGAGRPSRGRTSRSRAGGRLPRPRLATGLVLRAAGLPQPASASRRTLGGASGGRARPGAPP